jgi:RNA polymerase sigma-70 factor (ECF subfamily)
MILDVLGGRIQTIRSVVNPDKLGHLGPPADSWAVAREVKRARRDGRSPKTEFPQ